MSAPALTSDQNILPVQAYFNIDGSFNTFIGQGQPFYASFNPVQSGLTITNSTIDSTVIGGKTPSNATFVNVSTTTGSISTAPSNSTDLVNKAYVDMFVQGYAIKAECQVATTVNITLSGLQTIDGYTTLVGDRVLVKNQTNQANNGIYVAAAGAWSRSADANTYASLVSAFVFIQNGSTQQNSGWACTISAGGTLGVTPITWSQLASATAYFAGTGLTLSGYTFSITAVGTAGTYGSASSVPVFVTNSSGQVTSVTNTSISIAPSQINATIPNSGLTNSSITVNGSAISLGGSAIVTANTTNALTIGTGLSGTSFNGSSAVTVAIANTAVSAGSYTLGNFTVNAQGQLTAASSTSTTGSGNVVLATSPTLVTPALGTPTALVGTNITGTASGLSIGGNAATATSSTNIAGGSAYAFPYQTAASTTAFLSAGTSGQILQTQGTGSAPTWVSQSTLSVGTATNIAGGSAGAIAYNSAASTTTFLTLGTSGYVLTAGASAPQYVAQSTLSVNTATNLAGGIASQIPYQTGAGATSFIANGTTGQVLTSNGTSVPSWTTPTAYATVTDDTTTAGTRYILFANQTSGNLTTEYTSSTKLQYNPSTGVLTSTSFTGAGTGLTGTASSLSIGGTAAQANNLNNGVAGAIAYQSASNTTTFLTLGTTNYILTAGASAPQYVAQSTLSVGSATTATNATNTAITDNTSSSATWYPTIVSTTTGNLPQTTSSTKLSFVPSSGTLTATVFSGSLAASNLTGTTLPSSIVTSSLTSVGTITTGVWNGTAITNSYLANSSITINGNLVSLGGSTTVTASTTNALTVNNSGSGAASGSTFNGSAAVTVSYNSIGASPLAGSTSLTTLGTITTGTWQGSIIGTSYGGTGTANGVNGGTF